MWFNESMHTRARLLLSLLLITAWAAALTACNAPPPAGWWATATPRATATPQPTATPTITPTPTPSPTPQPAGWLETGNRALFEGDWETARAAFRQAQTQSPDPAVLAAAQLGLGRADLYARHYAPALEAFRTVITTYPNTAAATDAYFYLAQTYQALERYAEAAEAYQAFLQHRSGYIDAYLYEWMGDNRFNAGDYSGSASAYQAALDASPPEDRIYGIKLGIARAHHMMGDYATAIAEYQALYQDDANGYRRALLDWYIGQAYMALNDAPHAHQAYLDAVDNYPAAYQSYLALTQLVEAGVPVNDLNRGLTDYFAGQYGAAVQAFDRYINAQPNGSDTALYYKGLALRAMGNGQQATAAWQTLIERYPQSRFWDKAWEQKAYTEWAYLDLYDTATETLLAFVQQAPDHPRAAEFLFDAATVQARAANLARAAALWERLAQQYPATDYTFRALFQAAVTRYRLGEADAAATLFHQCADHAANAGDMAAAYLWLGKIYRAQGDEANARRAWERASASDPTGYYSERARDLLHDRAPFTPPPAFQMAVDWESEHRQAAAWVQQTFQLPDPPETLLAPTASLASNVHFIRGSELWRLGMYEEARAEFETLRAAVAADPADTFRLAEYFRQIGLYRSAVFAARHVLDLAGMDDATTLQAPLYFTHLRFGPYYRDLVVPIAQAYDFHPLFLFSVLRQESLFEGFVHSSAGARGLMQLMPATAQEIYQQTGWPPDFTADDLYRPRVSITYGAHYLARQRDYLDGDFYAALAAYNAGPGNAAQWQALAQGDPDLLLEIIPYAQTRDYIRRIYETFVIYRNVYASLPPG